MDYEKRLKIAAVAAAASYFYYKYVHALTTLKIKNPWRRRRWWMKTIHRNRTRETLNLQLNELLAEPSGEFENFTRMSITDFKYLLSKVEPMITKKNTQLREAIPSKIRLAITLRFLASGDSYKSLHYLFKVSSEIISKLVPEVCEALNQVLADEVKLPSSVEEWKEIEKGFRHKFPHALGAIDGKHVVMKRPSLTVSEYYNYKRTYSIVLLGLVDSNYRFLFAEIGAQGRISDGGVLRNSLLWKKICEGIMNFPPPSPLPDSEVPIPYVFLADGAFPLTQNIMKPYPGDHARGSPKRCFNETLSSARVFVENGFGILTSRFRVFLKPIQLDPHKVRLLTMTCILLHNFLLKSSTSRNFYIPPGTVDSYDINGDLIQEGSWRHEVTETCALRPLPQVPRRGPQSATRIRELFTEYFVGH